jgi:hypothetical protein
VQRFPTTRDPLLSVAVDGDTAASGAGKAISAPSANIFARHQDGLNAWGLQGIHSTGCCNGFYSIAIAGDYIVIGSSPSIMVSVLARNQGGPDAWGRVAVLGDVLVRPPYTYAMQLGTGLSISGDTALIGAPGPPDGSGGDQVFVLVSDVDGDGLRDGVDPCLRDPLNNVAGGCQRASGQYPDLGDLIVQETLTTDTRGKRFIITTTFTNTSESAVKNPFFEVTELTGQNVLVNGDAGRGGIGSTLSPDVGDGTLSPGESMAVEFIIRLRRRDPFEFRVVFRGEPVS